jgi:hypothetical protein
MKLIKTYNYFIAIAVVYFLVPFLFDGKSVLRKNVNDTLISTGLHYFSSVSFIILLIWISYFIFRKKIVSKKIILLHLIFTTVSMTVIPLATLTSDNPMPRMYEAFDKLNFFEFFGSYSITFISVSTILVLSILFLVFNINRKSD